jgi:superfamily I DNA and RNA helicase
MEKLDIVFGKKTNPHAVELLVNILKEQNWKGTLYVGYPIFASEDSSSVTDALLTCQEHGVVIFDLSTDDFFQLEDSEIEGSILHRQKELRRKLNSRLVAHEDLVIKDGISLGFNIKVVTFLPYPIPNVELDTLATPANLLKRLVLFPPLEQKFVVPLNAAVQKTAALKPRKKRLNVRKPDSMGYTIKHLESQIANLDRWQKNAAIESPEGPQRIRGLAGSGKTIILAMKAAYLHANDPEANIVVTFHTRSLYQQFKSLITRFYFDQVSDEPDWDKLRILHSWGSATDTGLYSAIAAQSGITPLPFGSARLRFGYVDAFKGVCTELVAHIKKNKFAPPFDYVLVDEAQDFPAAFFHLVYLSTKAPKKIVWAYDELQNLSDSTMPTLDELFGVDAEGNPVVEIYNMDGQPKQDILLPVCYRNPPWLLTLALGLGLGVKLGNGKFAQMFRDPDFWHEIGYESTHGNLALGQHVRLRRMADRSPPFFTDVLAPTDSVTWHVFENVASQAEWIANDIFKVKTNQELDLNDILIVIPDSIGAAKIGMEISNFLEQHDISSHLIGVNSSRDVVFVNDSVAICSIFRAKGNEAPLVYVAGAEFCNAGFDLSKKRNILFTALTRAKAWVRVCGVGASMEALTVEMDAIAANNFELDFNYPTQLQIEKMRITYKERTSKEKRNVQKEIKSAQKLLQRIADGELDLAELPPDLADILRKAFK